MTAAAVSAALAYGCLAVMSVRLCTIDIREQRLPDRPVLGLLFAVTALLTLAALLAHDIARLGVSLACGAGYFLAFASLAILHPGALGGGDVKLSPTIGVATGWMHVDAALIITPLALAAATLCTLAWRAASRAHPRRFAFGPPLIVSTWIGALSGMMLRLAT